MCAICEALSRSPAEALAAHDDGVGVVVEHETLPAGSVAANGKTVFSIEQVVTQLDRARARWAPGSTVSYQFHEVPPGGLPGDVKFAPLTAEQRELTRIAFSTISDVINLQFRETPDDGVLGRNSSKIGFYLNSDADSFVWGSAVRFTRGSSGGFNIISSAAIEISPTAVGARRWFVGGYNFLADMHEILHALGVSHPGDYNADGSSITYAANAPYYQDSRQYTAMSYFDASSTGANFVPPGENASYSLSTLGLHDIAALQALYGASNARATDTVYGYNSTAGMAAYDASLNNHPIFSIWDAGGNDTLDFSGSALAARLDLNAGEFSDAAGLTGNISIAYNVTIENARGGSAADTLVGNGVANVLDGGAGDDTLAGRGGNDTLQGGDGSDGAAYAGKAADYDWWWDAAAQAWIVDDARAAPTDGTDRLLSVEKLTFSDSSVALATPDPAGAVAIAYRNVLRMEPVGADAAFVSGLTAEVQAGRLTSTQAFAQIVDKAVATTSVATLAYEFFTGLTPSRAGLDYLVSPTGGNANNLNSAYYQSFSVENRFINFAVNLGKLGEGAAKFSSSFGAPSLFDATREVYRTVFGAAPTDAKLGDILNASFQLNGVTLSRAEYFAFYGGDGANGIGTKAAMAGWLLGEAAKSDVGVYARSNEAFLLDLADGAKARVDLIGAYAKAEYALGFGAGG